MSIPKKKWEDITHRQDLFMIPVMEEAGWETVFSDRDKLYGTLTPDDLPRSNVSFKTKDKRTWEIMDKSLGRFVWQVADIINGRLLHHRQYLNLNEVIEQES